MIVLDVDVDSESYDILEVNGSLICIWSSSETSSQRIDTGLLYSIEIEQNRGRIQDIKNTKYCYGLDQVLKAHVRSDQK